MPSDLVLDLSGSPRPIHRAEVTAALTALDGVLSVHLDPHTTWALISYAPTVLSGETILARLVTLGISARTQTYE